MKRFLFIIFYCQIIISFSQSINLGNSQIKGVVLMEQSEELYVSYLDSICIIDINSLKITKTVANPIDEINFGNRKVVVENKMYCVEEKGGGVMVLEENTAKRIDHSFTHKMQIQSSIFVYKDTVFRYGGYGFWSMRNFFTFFDTKTSEWEIVSPTGSNKFPNGSNESIVTVSNGNFYVYGGFVVNEQNLTQYNTNDELWRFNLKNKSWKFLGKTNLDINEMNVHCSYEEKDVFSSEKDEKLYLVDVNKNRIKVFKKEPIHYYLVPDISVLQPIYYKGNFYCFTKVYSTNSIALKKIKEEAFFGTLMYEQPFYYNNEKIYYGLGTVLLLIIIGVLFFRIKKWNAKKNRIVISDNQLTFKGVLLDFNDKEIEIIKLLLNSEQDVLSVNIMEIVENKNLNYAHNTKVMNGLIENTNFKLKSILGIKKDLITCKKSNLDKRIKMYSIEKSFFYINNKA